MTSQPAVFPDAPDKNVWVKQSVLGYIYGNAATAAVGSLAVAVLVGIGVYGFAPDLLVGAWFAAAFAIALGRGILILQYRKYDEGHVPDSLLKWFRAMNLLSGIYFGAGCWFFVPITPAEYQVMFVAAVLGANGGGIATYAADHTSFRLFMYPSCLIATVALLSDGSSAFFVMAILFIFFTIVLDRASKQAADTFHENISLGFSLHYRATHDSLTGLFNREEFENAYGVLSSNTKHGIALLFVDLDNFKLLNDTCGHNAGDEALKQVAEIIRSSIRHDDCAARLGGDEFVVLLLLDDLSVAEAAAEKIRKQIQDMPLQTQSGAENALGCSIGIAFSSTSSVSYKTLMNRADNACYASKARGKNQYTVDRLN